MIYRTSWYFTHPWEIIIELARNTRYFIQRGRRGYSEADVWNLDHYLSSWLPHALRDLKNCDNSSPGNITCKKWHSLLDKMAHGFEDYGFIDEKTGNFDLKKWKKEDSKRCKERELFAFWFWNLWD